MAAIKIPTETEPLFPSCLGDTEWQGQKLWLSRPYAFSITRIARRAIKTRCFPSPSKIRNASALVVGYEPVDTGLWITGHFSGVAN